MNSHISRSFPHIPGVTYNGLISSGDLFDFGPLFEQGILTILPPVLVGTSYPVFVPKTDADGNDIAGIRLPEVAVPLATYTGWGVRAAAFAGDDLCDAAGQKIDFLQTKSERLATGDPRLSIEERYPNHRQYVREVAHAAKRLHRRGLLLEEDVQRYIKDAEASSVAFRELGAEFDLCLQDDHTVLVRASGSFCIVAGKGKVDEVHHRHSRIVRRADGYSINISR
jgi:Alpha/beta hydrolase domain